MAPDRAQRATASGAQSPGRKSLTRAAPALTDLGVQFSYASSQDGIDSNLLVLLHGLGDSFKPFAQLGASLRLPQTAILALQAPSRVPLLAEEAYQWWDSFDLLSGALIERPNPTKAVELLREVLQRLTDQGWPAKSIHLLGFAQGGALALQTLRSLPASVRLGSVISICGGLLSAPAKGSKAIEIAPVLLFSRRTDKTVNKEDAEIAFGSTLQHFEARRSDVSQSMPRGEIEWKPVLQFLSEHLRFRPSLAHGEVVVELDQA